MRSNLKSATLMLAVCSALVSQTVSAAVDGLTPIATEKAPKAIGPYSQAIVAGSYMFLSGQIAIDPTTGKLAGDTIEEQTKQVLKNIEAILAAQGLTLENVVKCEVYLKDLKDFQVMNKAYAEKFSVGAAPARAAIQISKLPLDALIEISCVAFIPAQN